MRRVLSPVVVLILIVVALPAAGKGAVSATIEGEGLSGPIHIDQRGDPGSGTLLGNLIDYSGFFVVAFAEQNRTVAADRPAGELGPMLTIKYDMGGPTIAQEVYPLAEGGPAVYLEEGQELWDGAGTGGGWYLADSRLITALEDSGVSLDSLSSPGWAPPSVPPVVSAGVLAALLALVGAVVLRRRRLYPATG